MNQSASSLARLHALWSLQGLNALTEENIQRALNDSEPEIRRVAIRLAEPKLNQNKKLRTKVLALATDDDPLVRFQTAFTLGEIDDSQVAKALYQIARRDHGDTWIRTAVLSSLSDSTAKFLESLLADVEFAASSEAKQLLSQLANVIGTRKQDSEVKKAENKEITILRENIEEIRSSGKSLMPEGLEKKIKTQEMADLIAFLLALEN